MLDINIPSPPPLDINQLERSRAPYAPLPDLQSGTEALASRLAEIELAAGAELSADEVSHILSCLGSDPLSATSLMDVLHALPQYRYRASVLASQERLELICHYCFDDEANRDVAKLVFARDPIIADDLASRNLLTESLFLARMALFNFVLTIIGQERLDDEWIADRRIELSERFTQLSAESQEVWVESEYALLSATEYWRSLPDSELALATDTLKTALENTCDLWVGAEILVGAAQRNLFTYFTKPEQPLSDLNSTRAELMRVLL